MTTVAHGPYEHVGAYADLAESEVFDTSGVSESFCPSCEHDPCVAEYRRFPTPDMCGRTPRDLSVARVSFPIMDAGQQLSGQAYALFRALIPAVTALDAAAVIDESESRRELALRRLVRIRDDIRRVMAR